MTEIYSPAVSLTEKWSKSFEREGRHLELELEPEPESEPEPDSESEPESQSLPEQQLSRTAGRGLLGPLFLQGLLGSVRCQHGNRAKGHSLRQCGWGAAIVVV